MGDETIGVLADIRLRRDSLAEDTRYVKSELQQLVKSATGVIKLKIELDQTSARQAVQQAKTLATGIRFDPNGGLARDARGRLLSQAETDRLTTEQMSRDMVANYVRDRREEAIRFNAAQKARVQMFGEPVQGIPVDARWNPLYDEIRKPLREISRSREEQAVRDERAAQLRERRNAWARARAIEGADRIDADALAAGDLRRLRYRGYGSRSSSGGGGVNSGGDGGADGGGGGSDATPDPTTLSGMQLWVRQGGALKKTFKTVMKAAMIAKLAEIDTELIAGNYKLADAMLSGDPLTKQAAANRFVYSVGSTGRIVKSDALSEMWNTKTADAMNKLSETTSSIPIIGGMLEKARQWTIGGWTFAKNGLMSGDWRTDRKIVEDTKLEVEVQERKTELMRQQVAIRGQINRQLIDETDQLRAQVDLIGRSNVEKVRLSTATDLKRLGEEMARDGKYHVGGDASGPLTPDALALMAAKRALADAQITEAERQARLQQFDPHAEFLVRRLRMGGKSDEAELQQLALQQEKRYESLKETNPHAAEQYKLETMPGETEELKEKLARARLSVEKDLQQRIRTMRAEAEEATLRAAGAVYQADVRAFQRSLDEKVASLRRALETETDLIRRAQLEREIAATEAANKEQLRAYETQHAREVEEAIYGADTAKGVAQRKASRQVTNAKLFGFDRGWAQTLEKARLEVEGATDPVVRAQAQQRYDALKRQYAAERYEMESEMWRARQDRDIEIMRRDAGVARMSKVGEYESMREEIRRDQEGASDDTERELARRSGISRIREFMMSNRSRQTTYERGGTADTWRNIQQDILSGAANGRGAALASAAKDLQTLEGGGGLENRVDSAARAMDKAADAMMEQTKLFGRAKAIGVLKGD